MKSLLSSVVLVALSVSIPAYASPDCTTEPKDKWKDQKEFEKSIVEQGYKIKKFKVTSGNCYEVYGWDKDGKKVEIYYNPMTGEKVKEEVKGK